MKKLGFDIDEILKKKTEVSQIEQSGILMDKKNNRRASSPKSQIQKKRRMSKKFHKRKFQKNFADKENEFEPKKIIKNSSNISFKENNGRKINKYRSKRSVTPRIGKSKLEEKILKKSNYVRRRVTSRDKDTYYKKGAKKSYSTRKLSKLYNKRKKKNSPSSEISKNFYLQHDKKKPRKSTGTCGSFLKKNSKVKNKLRDILKKNAFNNKTQKNTLTNDERPSASESVLLDTFTKDTNKTQDWKESLRASESSYLSPGNMKKVDRSRSKSKSRSRSKKSQRVSSVKRKNYANLHVLKSELLSKKSDVLNRTPNSKRYSQKSKILFFNIF